mmetsp:Transcript_13236/g.25731  ORF Transcript_13236/g.25731 Transcript_13236/m.25731 type:complete len:486 (-) Transcript_13236:60-1517(-)
MRENLFAPLLLLVVAAPFLIYHFGILSVSPKHVGITQAKLGNKKPATESPHQKTAFHTGKPSKARIPTYMSELHGSALKYWRAHLTPDMRKRKVNLVHVDSHCDIMDVNVERAEHATRQELADELEMGSPAIGDFITRAIYAGWIQQVSWLRSDFDGFYNYPPVGTFSPKLCLNKVENVVTSQDFEPVGKKYSAKELASLGLQNANTEEHTQLRSKQKKWCSSPYQMSVSTPDLVAHVKEFVPSAGLDWILDIDLDFFASNDPGLTLFAVNGLDRSWTDHYFLAVFDCEEKNDQNFEDFSQAMLQLPSLAGNQAQVKAKTKKLLKARHISCRVSNQTKLFGLVDHLRQDQDSLKKWRQLWTQYQNGEIDSDSEGPDLLDFYLAIGKDGIIGPNGLPTRAQILKAVGGLGDLIKQLRERLGDPFVITIARSEHNDYYTPSSKAQLIQNATMKMLQNAFRASSGFTPNLASLVYDKDIHKEDRFYYF